MCEICAISGAKEDLRFVLNRHPGVLTLTREIKFKQIGPWATYAPRPAPCAAARPEHGTRETDIVTPIGELTNAACGMRFYSVTWT